jgi:hypothetical protein
MMIRPARLIGARPPLSRDRAAGEFFRYPPPSEHDVGLERLRVRDWYQPFGRSEHDGGEIREPIDRRAQPLTSEPAHGRAEHAVDRRRSIELGLV